MKRIDFICQMKKMKNYNYIITRQEIYNMDDRELNILESMDNDGNVYIQVDDFNTNKKMAIITKHKNENDTHATVCDEWLLQELQITEK